MLRDECVDRRLAADIQGHDVKAVPGAGWAALKNGDLLSQAQHEFDALVTTDRNLPFSRRALATAERIDGHSARAPGSPKAKRRTTEAST